MPEKTIASGRFSRRSHQPVAARPEFPGHSVAAIGAVILVLLPLVAVFGYLIYKGIGSINWAFLTQTPKPPGEAGGGMANAIAGSVYILADCQSAWAFPSASAPASISRNMAVATASAT